MECPTVSFLAHEYTAPDRRDNQSGQPERIPGSEEMILDDPVPGDETLGVGDWEQLKQLVRRFAGLGAYRPELAARADRLLERLGSQEFHIAVLGEFKRGKSTLVNALIGRALLPSGVLPLTTVTTEVHFGSLETTVTFNDGHRLLISPEDIGDYATEVSNPSNRLGVARIKVGVETVFGAPGLVLVDTPGVASVNAHNTQTAHEALLDCDAAVVVLSADSPLSESEKNLLAELGQRRAKVFVVINKSDHLSPDELSDVRVFVEDKLQLLLGYAIEPFCVAARTALEDAGPTEVTARAPTGFGAFKDALTGFVSRELVPARYAAALSEGERLGTALTESVQIEQAVDALDIESLSARVTQFEAAAADGRRLLDQDRVLLDHDVATLISELGQSLSEAAARMARHRQPLLAHEVDAVSLPHLDAALQDAIETSVREGFETLRLTAQDQVDESWGALATQFTSRVQRRVNELRMAANDLFSLHLPIVAIPAVGEQRDRFSYHFLHIESPGTFVGRFALGLLPARRRRALRRAERKLFEEFDKHAGRARYDISERLDAAKRRMVEDMTNEFEHTEQSIYTAYERAKSTLALASGEQRTQHAEQSEALELAATTRELVLRRRNVAASIL
jgi:small GTP-binding protein